MQSYQQSSSAIPQGPSTSTSSSSSSRNSKLDQIIQNFYTKTAQIVIQARCTPNNDARYGKRASLKGSMSTTKKMNKWFNIATEDVELLREDLKYWRTMAIQATVGKEPPPMILEIYLDTTKLSPNQSLVVADDNLRWCFVDLKTPQARIERIMIESWELTLNRPFPDYAVDLPNLYKRSIVFFRSLHSLARLLPTFDLYRNLHKDASSPLCIGYRLSTLSQQQMNEIALDSTILESDARKPTRQYQFTDIVTPIGTFKLHVNYRRNCDFRVEDAERDLSAQFIDMDEQFFTPTITKYQQQQQQVKPTRPVSMIDIKPKEIQTSLKTPTSSRRTSAQFVVSPFKSPFLSSSPQAEATFSGSTLSKQRSVPTTDQSGRKIEFSSSFDKYKSSPSSRTTIGESPSSTSMMRRWSRTSDHGSIHWRNEDDDLEDFVRLVGSNQELRLFQQPNRSTQQLVSSVSDSSSSSMMMNSTSVNKKAALSHFQNLRDTHNSLSDSLSSSIIMGNASSQQQQQPEPMTGVSPVSSTSSTGRSYQPIIPSPLHHTEQRSTSPVHIPRSYPQLRSMIHTQNALRIARASTFEHENDDDNDDQQEQEQQDPDSIMYVARARDMSAYSTYPQDKHHLFHLRHQQDVHTTGHSGYMAGKKAELPPSSDVYRTDEPSSGRGNNSSLMDDDDSLVFKMSELECEGPQPKHEMVFNNRYNIHSTTNSANRENEPTPLLHRLQTISMSTVAEEEEKTNSSGSSNKSAPTSGATRPSPLSFDTW